MNHTVCAAREPGQVHGKPANLNISLVHGYVFDKHIYKGIVFIMIYILMGVYILHGKRNTICKNKRELVRKNPPRICATPRTDRRKSQRRNTRHDKRRNKQTQPKILQLVEKRGIKNIIKND